MSLSFRSRGSVSFFARLCVLVQISKLRAFNYTFCVRDRISANNVNFTVYIKMLQRKLNWEQYNDSQDSRVNFCERTKEMAKAIWKLQLWYFKPKECHLTSHSLNAIQDSIECKLRGMCSLVTQYSWLHSFIFVFITVIYCSCWHWCSSDVKVLSVLAASLHEYAHVRSVNWW